MKFFRYLKHVELNGFGESGQKKISKSTILIIGAGGLGSPVLQYLSGAGVGKIIIYDDDIVRIDNLHRQTIYNETNIGQAKALCVKKYIEKINSNIKIVAYQKAIDIDNIAEALKLSDLVIDCTDNFRARYVINDACYFNSIPLISGAVTYTGGYFVLLNFKENSPCYRCVFPKVNNEDGFIPNCSDDSVWGPAAGVIGCFMASEALKYLSSFVKVDQITLNTLNFRNNSMTSIDIQKDPSCRLCGHAPSIKSMDHVNYEQTWRQKCST